MWGWFLKLMPLGLRGFVTRYALLIVVTAVLVVVGAVFWQGYRLGKASVTNRQIKADVEAVKEHGKLEAKIIRLSDPDLDKRLARWMRD